MSVGDRSALRHFERLDTETVFSGRIMRVEVSHYRYADGMVERREIVRSTGAVAIVAVDRDDHIWLVRQPREPVDDPDSLELPAGRLDKDGERPLMAAQRELAEEIGMRSDRWSALHCYRSSVGMTDEVVHIFLAERIEPVSEHFDSGERERIEPVVLPFSDLAASIATITDSKTLIGLLLLDRLRGN